MKSTIGKSVTNSVEKGATTLQNEKEATMIDVQHGGKSTVTLGKGIETRTTIKTEEAEAGDIIIAVLHLLEGEGIGARLLAKDTEGMDGKELGV